MLTQEIMTRRPVTGTPQMPIRRAQAVLRRGRFRHLPILERGPAAGRPLRPRPAAGARRRGSAEEPVAALVRAPAITAAPDTPVEAVARLLRDNKIGCLPIVEVEASGGEALVGIVTESDVFGAFVRAMGIAPPGSRVVVRLEAPAADLLRVARVLAERDAPLLSLSSEPLPPGPGDTPDRPAAPRPRAWGQSTRGRWRRPWARPGCTWSDQERARRTPPRPPRTAARG